MQNDCDDIPPKNMSINLCQPCERQEKQEPISHWCIQCNEMLCALCFEYHKVLKITKDHCFLTSNEYVSISQLLETMPLSCKTHANKPSLYFCSNHEAPCCIICKAMEHKTCSDVELIEDLVIKPEYEKQSNDVVANINKTTETLEKIRANRSENLEQIDYQYEQCKIHVQDKKQHLQKLLVDLDNTFQKFDSEYQTKRHALQNQIESFSSRVEDMKERRCMMQTLLKLKLVSPNQFFLAEKIIKGKNDEDAYNLRESVNTLSTLQCKYSISFKPDERNENILLIDMVSFKSIPCNIESLDFSMHDQDSSTVEDEEEIQLQPSSRSNQESSSFEHTDSVVSKDYATKTRSVCASKWKSEACLLGLENFQLKLKPNPRISNQNKIPLLKYKWHFQIEKKNPNIDVCCVKVLRDSNMIIAERSQPRLLTYNTSGTQLSEFLLQQKPEDMEIIPDNRIAVTLKKTVLIIDVTNLKYMKIAKEITLQKSCHGVTFLNQMLLVNCLNGDLVVITLDGSIVQKHSNYPGIWFIAGKDGTLLSVKRNSELVNFFNLSTTKWSYSRCPWLYGANGIVTDTNGNIFITCDYSNKVYMYHRRQSQWIYVLGAESNIDCPRGIAYDAFTNDIAIVNNAGKSVYIFKMT
ncbi:uncharacterized protein LOC127723417 [Mytilus californianus]|uniref:uncharacterized protein LOC127723417 n=1 Tax=Mytilus californianus TaxID=6549 RepID=UPI002247AB73|nr:uncharacterized protein LOC127723417 [Mytilus californianus]